MAEATSTGDERGGELPRHVRDRAEAYGGHLDRPTTLVSRSNGRRSRRQASLPDQAMVAVTLGGCRCSSMKTTAAMGMGMGTLRYLLSEHPKIIKFRWSPAETWFSTWSFLFTSIVTHILLSILLHLSLSLLGRRRLPLGPIPALHSLLMSILSLAIFSGTLLSTAADIRDIRWLWHRRRHPHITPLHWLLCFPLGTRPSGRIFFWSYAFYLSRLVQLTRTTLFMIVGRRRGRHLPDRTVTSFRLLKQTLLVCTSFLWLEFSQSSQVLRILLGTSLDAVVYGDRFWTGVGLPRVSSFPLVVICRSAVTWCGLACHVGVIVLHCLNGGCNGMGAWVFNCVSDGMILLMHFNLYSSDSDSDKSSNS
ncbi:hypothetical protein Dimus_025585 [Dionaea muscipula]